MTRNNASIHQDLIKEHSAVGDPLTTYLAIIFDPARTSDADRALLKIAMARLGKTHDDISRDHQAAVRSHQHAHAAADHSAAAVAEEAARVAAQKYERETVPHIMAEIDAARKQLAATLDEAGRRHGNALMALFNLRKLRLDLPEIAQHLAADPPDAPQVIRVRDQVFDPHKM